jgi:hypothetical protein
MLVFGDPRHEVLGHCDFLASFSINESAAYAEGTPSPGIVEATG